MNLQAIVFDMDGVLVDTPKYVTISFSTILKEKYGIDIFEIDRKNMMGLSLKDQIKVWKEHFKMKEDIDPIEFSKEAFKMELNLMKEIKADKYLIELLQDAKKKGIKLAVATSSTKERAYKLLDLVGIRDLFEKVITAEDVEKHKPDPEVYLRAAEEIKVNPGNCVVFEDALNGIKAAKSAGMRSIALVTEYNSIGDFKGYSDLIITSFSEINIRRLESLFE